MRFIGDRGYVVTFRQTDPLYTLDLADPARPRVTGELKILGYSSYLHPVGEHELLGIGQDATPEGIRQGTQLSLFDVADPADPKLLQSAALGELTLVTPSTTTTRSCGGRPRGSRSCRWPTSRARGRAGARLPRRPPRASAGRRLERDRDVLRTLVIGGRLFTLTDEGLHAYDLDSSPPGRSRPSRASSGRGCVAAHMTFSRRLSTLAVATSAALALSAAPSMAIVGGSDAAAGEYPSVAEVSIGHAFLCTGTLIAPNYVLTAGHCGSITGGTGVASPAAFPRRRSTSTSAPTSPARARTSRSPASPSRPTTCSTPATTSRS